MKYLILSCAVFLAINMANAGTIAKGSIHHDERKVTIGNAYVASPTDISNAQYSSYKDIQYMIDHYTTEEMAQYVIGINNQLRKTALDNKKPIPDRLSKDILSDKEKMGEYLRSLYRFEY